MKNGAKGYKPPKDTVPARFECRDCGAVMPSKYALKTHECR